ncbi:hypothetical protein [Kribbella deserti]|uniref:Transmembrane protein n=1 Tax=Kribbella deserti TaxID=1926257 RepID=A0ABV6QQM3_9ACTN
MNSPYEPYEPLNAPDDVPTGVRSALPDQDVPAQIAAAGKRLDRAYREGLDRLVVGITLVAGWTLLLPWTYSRRLGLQVWRLGIEQHPVLGIAWLLGFAAAITAWRLRHALIPLGVSASTALIFTGWAWQDNGLPSGSDTWPGPGPSAALTLGLIWILACVVRLLAERRRPAPPPDPKALEQARTRLRRTRAQRPLDLPAHWAATPNQPEGRAHPGE